MENEKKKKMSITPEQIDKASEKMGKVAESVDNLYGNVKGRLGAVGTAIGFGVLATFLIALVHSPGLVWILGLMIALGAAPIIRKKYLEVKSVGEAHLQQKKADAQAKAAESDKKQ